jgi:N-acetylmuramoyl-L-alanine amidase
VALRFRAGWFAILGLALGVLATAMPVRAETEHTVAFGETLSSISLRYGIAMDILAQRNGIRNLDRVFAGQQLVIPTTGAQPTSRQAATHRVAPGETLSAIAMRYGVSMSALASANGIQNPNWIYVGQVLALAGGMGGSEPVANPQPSGQSHRVAPGESLGLIAMRYGVSQSALARENSIANPHWIYVGQVLRIPGAAAVAYDRAYIERALIEAEAEFGLPHGLLRALAWQESGWQQHVVSSAGAIGVTQLMPETAAWLLRDFLPDAWNWREDPRDNARLGAVLLRHLLFVSGGDLDYTLAAYYQGAGNIQRWGIFGETWQYIANVRAIMRWYS